MLVLVYILACAPADPAPALEPVHVPSVPVPEPQAEPEPEAVVFHAIAEPIPPDLAARMRGVSWREGCPTALDDLRVVRILHWDWEGEAVEGALVVHHDAVEVVRASFEAAFEERFPIRSMRPVSEFGGSDDRSMAADNTSAFNCRPIKGTSRWSEHSSGRAIDVNPRENPWVKGDRVDPPDGRDFLDRQGAAKGMLKADSALVRAFRERGWGWGGTWSSLKDYQHFSASGR